MNLNGRARTLPGPEPRPTGQLDDALARSRSNRTRPLRRRRHRPDGEPAEALALEPPAALVSLRSIDELSGSRSARRPHRIGATRSADRHRCPAEIRAHYPALVEADPRLRQRADPERRELGGNLCNASPGADSAPPLLVYGAQVELSFGRRRRPDAAARGRLLRGPGETALQPRARDHDRGPARAPRTRRRAPSSCARSRVARWTWPSSSVAVLLEISTGGHLPHARAWPPARSRRRAAAAAGGRGRPRRRALDDDASPRPQEVARGESRPITDLRASADVPPAHDRRPARARRRAGCATPPEASA